MPINLTISHADKLVVAVADGEIDRAEIDEYLTALIAAGAMSYRKLFDISFAPLSLGVAELRALGKRSADAGPTGPLAIVVGSNLAREMAAIFESQAAADRPLRIFDDLPTAREWLDSFPP